MFWEELEEPWTLATLGSACQELGGDVQTGPFGSQLHASDYVESGIPLVMPKNIKEDRISTSDIARITEKDAQRLDRYRLTPGDVVCSRRGDVERRALVTEDQAGWLCGTGCLRVRLESDRVDHRYLYYYFGHPDVRRWIVRHAQGATMPNLNTGILEQLPFAYPPVLEQTRIGSILGALDDKIEVNRKMNRTLEEIAQTLFRFWCVHRDDFPGSFEPSWDVGQLDEIATFLNGTACQKYPPQEGPTLPVIKIRELRGGITEESDAVCRGSLPEKYRVQSGDILFSWSASLLLKIWRGQEAALNQHIFKVDSEVYPRWFVYHWIQHHLENFRRIARDKATTMGHIRRKHLSEAEVNIPGENLMEELSRIFEPIFERLGINEIQTQTLAEIRDTLLPKLISGEIRVPEAEKMVEEMA